MSADNPFDIPSDPIKVEPILSPDVPEGNPFATMTAGVQQVPQQPQQPLQQVPQSQQPTTNMSNSGFSGFNEPPPQAQPQQPQFNNGFQNNAGGFGGNQSAQKRKYKFVQMYWLINPKLFAQQQLVAGEAPLIEISYNVDYGNVRLTFIKTSANTFDATSIRVQNTERLATVNIYPETADQVLFYLEKGIAGQFQIFERMIQATASWVPNKSVFTINQDGSVTLTSQAANSQTPNSYVFSGWQIESLKKILRFLTDGSAYIIDIAKFLAPIE